MDEQFKRHGAFSWCELMTADVEAAKAFYSKLFGWTTDDMQVEGRTNGDSHRVRIVRLFRF